MSEQETPGQREAREHRERATEASARVVRLVKKGAPIEQVEYADDEATDLWLKTWAQERLNKAEVDAIMADLQCMHDEGCPHHDPVE